MLLKMLFPYSLRPDSHSVPVSVCVRHCFPGTLCTYCFADSRDALFSRVDVNFGSTTCERAHLLLALLASSISRCNPSQCSHGDLLRTMLMRSLWGDHWRRWQRRGECKKIFVERTSGSIKFHWISGGDCCCCCCYLMREQRGWVMRARVCLLSCLVSTPASHVQVQSSRWKSMEKQSEKAKNWIMFR